MAGVEQVKVESGEAGMRLDRWFKVHYPGLGFGHLQKLLRSGQIRVIAHELTEPTRKGLHSGAIDVVLDQNPDGEIREAIEAARTLALDANGTAITDPIEIGIFLRDNLR